MNIVIAGASGFVGKNLLNYYIHKKGFHVSALKRTDISEPKVLEARLSAADVVINLSGTNIVQHWNKKYKKKLYESRIRTTTSLVKAMNKNTKQQLFISTSAIGIYKNDIESDETSELREEGFLSMLCKEWEKAAQGLSSTNRLVIFRYGVVLADDGGALHKMLLPFKLGLGGNIGTGNQTFSFIAMKDLVRIYDFVIAKMELNGVFNLTTPSPTTNKIFSQYLAKKLNRTAFLHMPHNIIRLFLGEAASVLIEGQKVYPKKLLKNGFIFELEHIEDVVNYYL